MRPPGVAPLGEDARELLELGEGGGLGAEPFLEGLLESPGFPWVWGLAPSPLRVHQLPSVQNRCNRAMASSFVSAASSESLSRTRSRSR